MPVMMIPNAVPVSINPQSTPITDRATEVMMVSGRISESNWVTSTIMISSNAMTKARERKAVACCSSWLAPENSHR